MSGQDLYLVLRERLSIVAEGFNIGTDVLDTAQAARGFSHERMARELGISEKTWRRWKAKGSVPPDHLEDVARVLRLDIEQPRQRVLLNGDEPTRDDQIADLQEQVLELRELAVRILQAVEERDDPPAPPEASAG